MTGGPPLLLAGSVGPERVPPRPDRDDADWFKPLHVRDEAGARERIARQVERGADVVLAPTWLTHRRALRPVGETRRVAEWTAAAIRVARDAVEIGLERREDALADAPDDDVRRGRPAPLVAGVLPPLDETASGETGRLLPREAATQRDDREQAGVLADATPDLLLVAGHGPASDAHVAAIEAADTGLPTWLALGAAALSEMHLEEWLDRARSIGTQRLLVPPPLEDRLVISDAQLAWGVHGAAPAAVADWLAAGAGVVARLDGATADALVPLRAAIDRHEHVEIAARQAVERRWSGLISRAAAMAPGGSAVMIGPVPGDERPEGFEWLTVEASEVRRLPDDHYRLVVAGAALADLDRLLVRGGILAQPYEGGTGTAMGLRPLSVDASSDPALAIYRRDG